MRVERLGPNGVLETSSQKAEFKLPVKLQGTEATALVITPQ